METKKYNFKYFLITYKWKFELCTVFNCNLSEPEDIAVAIKRADLSYHILLIVRGGDKGFEEFNDIRIIEAIQDHERYVVTDLEHTEDETISDTVSCYYANVTADTAPHIKTKCIQKREKEKSVIETTSVSDNFCVCSHHFTPDSRGHGNHDCSFCSKSTSIILFTNCSLLISILRW